MQLWQGRWSAAAGEERCRRRAQLEDCGSVTITWQQTAGRHLCGPAEAAQERRPGLASVPAGAGTVAGFRRREVEAMS